MNKNYIRSIRLVAIGYLICFLDIYLLNINLLPNFIAYYLFFKAIDGIDEYENSAHLLKPIILILGIVSLIDWVMLFFNMSIDYYPIMVIVESLTIYFDYQLLTNIENIMKIDNDFDYCKLMYGKNIHVIAYTIYMSEAILISYININNYIQMIIFLTLFLATIYVIVVLWLYKNHVKRVDTNEYMQSKA